ncbi:MAG: AarF/ABC1/UbiB kinase family protein [Myxococcales bacterium]|nr:AarF/ABC1/UbiB kinase family protein [Myxococcales bacterium]
MLRKTRAYRIARVAMLGMRVNRRYRRLRARDAAGGRGADAEAWSRAHERTATELHDLAIDLEGLYIKLCQIVGARGDVFPEPFTRILGRFHDSVPARPFAKLRPGVEAALGRPLEDVFEHVDPEPLAAASLAQVHRARLKDGQEVVLKVQYPEVATLVRVDLGTLQRMSRRFMGRSSLFDAESLLEEMRHFLDLELDFEREAESTERVRRAFADDPRVRIPEVKRELSSRRLLVLEYLEGVPLTNSEALGSSGVDGRAFAERIATLFAEMIFEQGFFHGDPHPGNLLLLPDGVVGLLDFGLAKELPEAFGPSMARLLAKTFTGDMDGALEAARAVGFNLDELNPALLERIVKETMGGVERARVRREASTDQATSEAGRAERPRRSRSERRAEARQRQGEFEALAEGGEPIRIPPHFALVGRTVMLLDGLSDRLAPGEKVVQRTLFKALMPYAGAAMG